MAKPKKRRTASALGLTAAEARKALARHGENRLPEPPSPSLIATFFRQFLNPFVYILLFAAAISAFLGDMTDAGFIFAVLLINSLIGAGQEHSANRAAASLKKLEQPLARVIRDGVTLDIPARLLVPGDLVLVEAGSRTPADIRLVEASDLRVDESLLTGESLAVEKKAGYSAPEDAGIAGQHGMLFAGTMVMRGRGRGIVEATGLDTQIGHIAASLHQRSAMKPPLLIRMEKFTRRIALSIGVVVILLVAIGLTRGLGWHEIFLLSIALAVSAIPEGLPIAISVALAISMRRMAKRHVIVRNMPAVESLGSCTLIATDKTGTLTLNQLSVTDILLPDGAHFTCEVGQDITAGGIFAKKDGVETRHLAQLLRAAVLPNEAALHHHEKEGWKGTGDTVDVALLAAAHKGDVRKESMLSQHPLLSRIPYEPDLRYAASFHREEKSVLAFVKGAPEQVMAMSGTMWTPGGPVPIDREGLLIQKELLAAEGLRVLAFAEACFAPLEDGKYSQPQLQQMTFLGMVGMRDPVRPEVPEAIKSCYRAGVQVVMVTGDDPRTAEVIARQAGMDVVGGQVVTGADIRAAEAEGAEHLDTLTREARVYARVEPAQKLAIVESLARNGHFVAVTGDGVNDAPALRHAHVGVAMGKKGTDIARDSADIIITDDNFTSIVTGIRGGRIAYANIRKVIFMLISTGAAEVIFFMMAMMTGLPVPLLAVQLLWLNLITNGIQDMALACEQAEGDELTRPPRRPQEPIFDRLMLRRILWSSAVMGLGGFALFAWLLDEGYSVEAARNLLLLQMVLFENVQTFNSRSERRSLFRMPLLSNPFLLLGVMGALGTHLAGMYLPWLQTLLRTAPISGMDWAIMLATSLTLFIVMELDKRYMGTKHS